MLTVNGLMTIEDGFRVFLVKCNKKQHDILMTNTLKEAGYRNLDLPSSSWGACTWCYDSPNWGTFFIVWSYDWDAEVICHECLHCLHRIQDRLGEAGEGLMKVDERTCCSMGRLVSKFLGMKTAKKKRINSILDLRKEVMI